MGKIKPLISPKQEQFIRRQHLFFVATCPLEERGSINVSPKGLDSFRVIGPNRVAYLDLTGAGNETAAHINQNGRIVFMFCAFEGSPNILRLHGRGSVVLPDSAQWNELISEFDPIPGMRQIITAQITRVQDSCGFGIPLFSYEGERGLITKWAEKMGPEKLIAYRQEKNARSIDGIAAPLSIDQG